MKAAIIIPIIIYTFLTTQAAAQKIDNLEHNVQELLDSCKVPFINDKVVFLVHISQLDKSRVEYLITAEDYFPNLLIYNIAYQYGSNIERRIYFVMNENTYMPNKKKVLPQFFNKDNLIQFTDSIQEDLYQYMYSERKLLVEGRSPRMSVQYYPAESYLDRLLILYGQSIELK